MKSITKINDEKFNKWKEDKVVVYVNPEEIILTEKIHLNSRKINLQNVIERLQDKERVDHIIVIRQLSGGKFSLIRGIKWLLAAKKLNKPIACIIVQNNLTHRQFNIRIGIVNIDFKIPKGTDDVIQLHNIKIPNRMAKTTPGEEKYNLFKQYFEEHGCLDKPITVHKDKWDKNKYILTNGYIRYLILQEKGIRRAAINYV